MENHDEAYRIWREAEVSNRTLIHLDAHHDMWWIPEGGSVTIANFICRALADGLVGTVYWVVPDATWYSVGTRRPVMEHLRSMTKRYPGGITRFDIRRDQISTLVLGKPLIVCPLASLPSLDEDVLLDIDTDYLILPHVVYGESDAHGPVPWCWPNELLARLKARGVRSDLATVVYSVEGGYTPLKWKYLGDELATRLRNPGRDSAKVAAMQLMHEAALAAGANEMAKAEEQYCEATKLCPQWSPPHYNLARLFAAAGRIAEAEASYRQAVAFDASYIVASDSAGLLYQAGEHREPSELELAQLLSLDPDDAYTLFGLARSAAKRGKWLQAEVMVRRCLAFNSLFIEAHRLLGDVMAHENRRGEAISAYEQSLKLGLAGQMPLYGSIATCPPEEKRLQDSDHCLAYARLASLYAAAGNVDRAINAYRMSIGGGNEGPVIHARLASLYARTRRWRESANEAWSAVTCVPGEMQRLINRVRRSIRAALGRRARANATASG